MFSRYRLNVSTNNGGDLLALAELTMLEDASAAAPITITASSTAGINEDAGFSVDDVGRVIALLGSNAVYRSFRITAVIDATHVETKLDDAPLKRQLWQGHWGWSNNGSGAFPAWYGTDADAWVTALNAHLKARLGPQFIDARAIVCDPGIWSVVGIAPSDADRAAQAAGKLPLALSIHGGPPNVNGDGLHPIEAVNQIIVNAFRDRLTALGWY